MKLLGIIQLMAGIFFFMSMSESVLFAVPAVVFLALGVISLTQEL